MEDYKEWKKDDGLIHIVRQVPLLHHDHVSPEEVEKWEKMLPTKEEAEESMEFFERFRINMWKDDGGSIDDTA